MNILKLVEQLEAIASSNPYTEVRLFDFISSEMETKIRQDLTLARCPESGVILLVPVEEEA